MPDDSEVELGLSITNADSDGDGVEDGVELINRRDPAAGGEAPIVDSDGDGLADSGEKEFSTSIRAADSDRDGLSDLDELLLLYDPLNPDTDSNGLIDSFESRSRGFRFVPGSWHF